MTQYGRDVPLHERMAAAATRLEHVRGGMTDAEFSKLVASVVAVRELFAGVDQRRGEQLHEMPLNSISGVLESDPA